MGAVIGDLPDVEDWPALGTNPKNRRELRLMPTGLGFSKWFLDWCGVSALCRIRFGVSTSLQISNIGLSYVAIDSGPGRAKAGND